MDAPSSTQQGYPAETFDPVLDDEFASDDEEFVVTFRTPTEEDDNATSKRCCSRCKGCCKRIWCWKLPVLFLPLLPILLIDIILISVFLGLFFSGREDLVLSFVAAKWWALAVVITFNAAIVTRLIVGVVYLILEAAFSESARIAYYVNDLGWPIAILGWGGGCLAARQVWLDGIADNVKRGLDVFFIMVMVLAAARIAQIIVVKFIISMLNSQRFWEQVAESLFRQRVLLKLLADENKFSKRHDNRSSSSRGSPSGSSPASPEPESKMDHELTEKPPMHGKGSKVLLIDEDTKILAPESKPLHPTPKVAAARAQTANERLGGLVSFKKIRQLYRNHKTQMHLFDSIPKNEDQIKIARMRHAEIRKAAPGSSASRISAEAKIDGNIIFESLDIDNKGYIVESDLDGCFKAEEKRKKAFQLLQLPPKDKTKIRLKEVVKAVSEVYQEREKLIANLRDRQSVAGVLSKLLGFILFIICIIVFITLLGVDWLSVIAPFGTAVLAISFVFGSAASAAFKSFIFLIFVKPYDVGDRIVVDGTTLKVNSISLLSSTFFTPDGRKVTMPNAILADATIFNHTRSRDVSLSISFGVDINTAAHLLAELRLCINKWLKMNRHVWDTDLGFWIGDIIERRALNVSIWVTLIGCKWNEVGRYLDHKSDLLVFINESMLRLGIVCYSSMTRVYMDEYTQVRAFPPSHSRGGGGGFTRRANKMRLNDDGVIDEDVILEEEFDDKISATSPSRHSMNFRDDASTASTNDAIWRQQPPSRHPGLVARESAAAVKLLSPKSGTPVVVTPELAASPPDSPTRTPNKEQDLKRRKKKQ